jgi:hypothetical protein
VSELRVGDIVNVTITGVPVTAYHEPGEDLPEVTVLLDCEIGSAPIRLPIGWPMVAFALADPQWWPPQPTDLLRTEDGTAWFATRKGSNTYLISAFGDVLEPQEAWEQRHRITLVRRESEVEADTTGGAR